MEGRGTGPSRPGWGSVVSCTLTLKSKWPFSEWLFLPLSIILWLKPSFGVSCFLCEATWPTTGERETVPLIDPFPGSRVFPDKDVMLNAAFALASEISSKSPVAVQGSKINLIYSRDHSVDESLDYMVRPAHLHPLPPIVALLVQGAQPRLWGAACAHLL